MTACICSVSILCNYVSEIYIHLYILVIQYCPWQLSIRLLISGNIAQVTPKRFRKSSQHCLATLQWIKDGLLTIDLLHIDNTCGLRQPHLCRLSRVKQASLITTHPKQAILMGAWFSIAFSMANPVHNDQIVSEENSKQVSGQLRLF